MMNNIISVRVSEQLKEFINQAVSKQPELESPGQFVRVAIIKYLRELGYNEYEVLHNGENNKGISGILPSNE